VQIVNETISPADMVNLVSRDFFIKNYKTAYIINNCGMEQMSANYLYIFDDGAWHVYGLDRTSEWIGLEVTKNMEEQ
jgi:hypothetical protein